MTPLLPAFQRSALLLDLDGTLIDIAPRPDLVTVPPGLRETLSTLRDALGGALAVITGRPIPQIDVLLADAPYAVAGEHGAAIRHAPGQAEQRADLPAAPVEWLARGEQFARATPGVLLEHKSRGFVLHYRAAPEAGAALRAWLEAMLANDPRFDLLPAHMAWEVRPRGIDKGTALAALMRHPPFLGRLPLFIGDDVTDEDAIVMARKSGGTGLRVDAAFGDPNGVRAWLARAAAGRGWPPLPMDPGEA